MKNVDVNIKCKNNYAINTLFEGWNNPKRTYNPHTRWWWPGNALTNSDVTYQMEQMALQGMGGVEIMNTWKCYEKGNYEYLSSEHIQLLKHAVNEGKRLDLKVAITFSPGWSFGGAWVPKEDQSKSMIKCDFIVKGPTKISHLIGKSDLIPVLDEETCRVPDVCNIIAIVAARLSSGEVLDADSLTVLTSSIRGDRLIWDVPKGNWQITTFYLVYTGQVCQANSFHPAPKVIDHLNKGAVDRYCEYLIGVLKDNIGDEFGKTVDSFFCDSFEVIPSPEGLLWSNNTLVEFEKVMGYDLTPYLPAIWYEISNLSEHIRYDINYFLHITGLKSIFETFNKWCSENGVQARVQPHYRFTTEIVQASGAIPRPETELTTKKFETVADPRKATVSGCRFYGSSHVSAEAYTFINKYRYSTELKDLKIASDAFFRDGITQIYNHGYFASSEKLVDPTRDFLWANHINHQNVWWKYYRYIANYISRCCFMLRQGRFVANILIYSPQVTAWTKRVLWGSERRVMNYGNLPKTLIANGYDYDIINDDLLQNYAKINEGNVSINGHSYRIIILPAITAIPFKTIKVIEKFIKNGGIVIALQDLPNLVPGLLEREEKNNALRVLVNDIFCSKKYQNAYYMPDYKIEETALNPQDQVEKPVKPLEGSRLELIHILGEYIRPDIIIGDYRQSEGLTFIHNKYNDIDIYFVTNLSSKEFKGEITFDVSNKRPQKWDALTGKVSSVTHHSGKCSGTTIYAEFNEWESVFYVFAPKNVNMPVCQIRTEEQIECRRPHALKIEGEWQVKLESEGYEKYEYCTSHISSLTDNPRTKHFSGTASYNTDIIIPDNYLSDKWKLILDLGKVGMIAEVLVNGNDAEVVFMPPYKLDITSYLKKGKNHLTVMVTNVLLNYVNGLKGPTDIEEKLQDRLGEKGIMEDEFKQQGNTTYLNQMYYEINMDGSQLPSSGLMGPVQIIPE